MNILDSVRIVLENPKSAKNVGSVCRAMKNMGFSRLYIAGPSEIDREKADVTAVHASDILDRAVFCPDVETAIAGTSFSAAVSRRRGKKRKYFSLLPEQLAAEILPLCGEGKPDIAIVFGNEVSGLNDHDTAICSAAVRIPSSDEFPSLNLSHAVQVITYAVYREYLESKPSSRYTPVTREETDELTASIAADLKLIGFFKQVDDSDMRTFFRDIFSRAGISRSEANRLKSIFTKIRGLASKDR